MGDYTDLESPSGRMRMLMKQAAGHDVETLGSDKIGIEYTNEAFELLKPLVGKFYGLIRGHHWCPFSRAQEYGSTVDMLADLLGTVNLGDCAMLELVFREDGDSGRKLKAHVWAHHGTGSGMVATSAMTRLEHMTKTFYSDVYLMGHQSKKGVSVIPWIVQDGGTLTGRNRYIVATGGFMEGYQVGSVDPLTGTPGGSYVEGRMLTPVALGAPLISFRPMFEEGRVDISVSV
jgi:hypothetical protein